MWTPNTADFDLGLGKRLELSPNTIVDLAAGNDNELPTWNAPSSPWHAEGRAARDASSASWNAVSGFQPGFELAHATGSAGAKIPEMGPDAEEAVWREAQGWVCGHGQAGM